MTVVLLFFFEGGDGSFDGIFVRLQISVFREADSKHSDMLIGHLAHCRRVWTGNIEALELTT